MQCSTRLSEFAWYQLLLLSSIASPCLCALFGGRVGVAAAAVLVWKVGSRKVILWRVPRFLGRVCGGKEADSESAIKF